MANECPISAAEKMEIASRSTADSISLSPRRARNAAGLDGRVRMARRLKAVLAELTAQFGSVEIPLLQRCAELQVCAEQARARLVRGDHGITIDEIVKLENLSARALRDLQARTRREPTSGATPLAEYLATRYAAPQPQDEPATTLLADSETLAHEAPADANDASGDEEAA